MGGWSGFVTFGAFALTSLAVWGHRGARDLPPARGRPPPSSTGLREVWAGAQGAYVHPSSLFLSMTAYFMQELILEPYSGLVFGFTPGQSTTLSGAHNAASFLGMVVVLGTPPARRSGFFSSSSYLEWFPGLHRVRRGCLLGISALGPDRTPDAPF